MGQGPLSSQGIAKPNLQYYDRHCPEKTKLRRLLQALGRQGLDSQSEGAEASMGSLLIPLQGLPAQPGRVRVSAAAGASPST